MASLLVLSGGDSKRYPLTDDETLVGRHPNCQIAFTSNMISARHLRIMREGDGYYVEDLNSRNGTQLNGVRLQQRARLADFDEITLGHVVRARFESITPAAVRVDSQMGTGSTIKGELSDAGKFGHLQTQSEAKLKAVLEIGSNLVGIIDPQSVLPTILETLFHIFPGADRGNILVLDDESGEMTSRASRQRVGGATNDVRLSRTIVDKVLQEKKGILSEDAATDSQFGESQSVAALSIRSMMCVPLLGLNGEPMGLISIDTQNPMRAFRDEDLDVLMLVARQVGMAYESSRLLERYLEDQQKMYQLRRQAAELRQFFSPKVVETLNFEHAEELLQPRVTDVTVLFCDIRGFSRRAERSQHDLESLMERCGQALGLMTYQILEFGGVISDFQGDAALGFWGWPVVPADGPMSACRAAMAIYREFAQAQQDSGHALSDFNIGIGIAHGRAIAGKIGVKVQSKIGVFGQVVNLGARLEGMTKELRVPILVDESTAQFLRDQASPAEVRCRRMPRVRPYGMDTEMTPFQLLPPESDYPVIQDKHIQLFEAAVDAHAAGDWSLAMDLLDQLPVDDRAKDSLLTSMALQGYTPPESWDGVHQMSTK